MLRVRRALRELEEEYEGGNKQPLEDLMRAWKGIKEKDPDDPLSFFTIGGYHGEPFGPPRDLELYWGGYCNHGNVLFPIWHRLYVVRLEEALQSIVPGVMMPYWDETSQQTLDKGIPWSLTADTIELDGETIPNPLKSYVLQRELPDTNPSDNKVYYKPVNYETCRYPLSGLVGSDHAIEATRTHNAMYPDYNKNVELLNTNIRYWLIGNRFDYKNSNQGPAQPDKDGVYHDWSACLSAPNYTAFSNVSSAQQWNQELDESGLPKNPFVVPLENPHNSIHLAVGGYDLSGSFNSEGLKNSPYQSVKGANGDMGENNTAGFDPIFFFHHCNVDRMFWVWQKLNGFTNEITITPGYSGTNSNDYQGPTKGMEPDTELTMQTPLMPFKKNGDTYYTAEDCINIETQLNFTYSAGSLDNGEIIGPGVLEKNPRLIVTGLKTNMSKGSYVVLAFFSHIDESGAADVQQIGTYPVLTRWNTEDCRNCQSHVDFNAIFDLGVLPNEILQNPNVTRDWFRVLIRSQEHDVDQDWTHFELVGWRHH